MKALIKNIKITDRIRKEVTKIDELAADIRTHGLLNPITVMPVGDGEFRLLAGFRRLKAVESMGLDEIDVNIVSPSDAEMELRIEISENEQREPFTFSEKMDYARLIEEIEKDRAKARMLSGKKNETDPLFPGAEGQKGNARDKAAEKIGMSGVQFDRAKYIADKVAANEAPPEIIDQLDKGERQIRPTYDELRAKEKAEKHRSYEQAVKTDPLFIKLKAQEDEAARKREEFEALSPEGKIAELQRQNKKLLERAVIAETDLSTLKQNYGISVDHKDSIIEHLKQQLTTAHERIAELESAIL